MFSGNGLSGRDRGVSTGAASWQGGVDRPGYVSAGSAMLWSGLQVKAMVMA